MMPSEPMIHMTAHAQAIQKAIEDINGIIAVLDPEGYKQAEEWKAKRERREHENLDMGSQEDHQVAVGEA